MRLSNCNSPYSCSVWRWNSTVPYLFGGLAFIFLLISIALVILACAHCRKKWRISSPMTRGEIMEENYGNNGTLMPGNVNNQIDIIVMKPKIVVIMAGDDKPSYLATPSLA
ncbi:PREDICTED: protein GLUTAMINE DUMPER 2-like [Nicotiana attenuata]|uniref:Uncharacterized protein n=1 Tax=Nicotiana attenuata TaxID=49451 RepID=A0A314L2R8_NICAT|nr:PREDICTED: protein GLUTAMINE DUMPER 2-like [Nicotiana attenuata]OIT35936.1 hypothetical protein A4A49_51835 [Nicotiana attenuata]